MAKTLGSCALDCDITHDPVEGFIAGINDHINKVAEAARKMAEEAANAAKNELDEHFHAQAEVDPSTGVTMQRRNTTNGKC